MKNAPGQTVGCQEIVLPGARAALVLLLLINLFNYIDRQVLAAVVDPIRDTFFAGHSAGTGSTSLDALQDWCRTHLGFKPELALIGVLSMAFMVTYMLGAPLFGRLAERRSRWVLVGVGVVLWSLASGASGLAGTFFALLLTRCFVGIGEAAYGPVAPAIISDFYPVKMRGQVLAWFYMAIPVGSALGYVIGGAIARSSIAELGSSLLGVHAESWRWAFYLVVFPGLGLGIWSFLMREPARGQGGGTAKPPRVHWKDYLILFRTPSYVLCSLGMTAMTFAIGGIAFWMPYYLKHRPGASGPVEVIFGGIVCVAGLVATLLGGIAGDKLRPRFSGAYFLVSGLAMLLGFPFMVAMLHSPFPTIWVLVFVTCFCLFFNTGPTNTILANVTHPSIRAGAFAINIFIIHAFGDVISPMVIGIISDRYNMNAAFLVVGAMFILAGLFWLSGVKFLARDEAAAARLTEWQQLRPSRFQNLEEEPDMPNMDLDQSPARRINSGLQAGVEGRDILPAVSTASRKMEFPGPLPFSATLLWTVIAAAAFHLAYATPVTSCTIALYLFALLQLARTANWRHAFYSGLAVGLLIAVFRLQFFWTIFSAGALALWLVYAVWLGIFVTVARLALSRLKPTVAWVAIPFIWTGLEYFRSEIYYLRFSWLNVGFAFADAPWRMPLAHLGTYGIGFAVMCIASFASALWQKSRVRSIAGLVVGTSGLIAWGMLAANLPASSSSAQTRQLHIAGIQLEFPTENEVLTRLNLLVRTHPETDLAVLSEYTFTEPVPEKVKQWCRNNHRYLVVGGTAPARKDNFYDTAFVIGPDGEEVFRQGKAVPIQFFKDGLPAPERRVWDSPWGKIGFCVCYDLSYTRVTDRLVELGAQALVVPTMDVADWGLSQHRLHARVAPVRAAEYGVPIFRLASSGISQLVESNGRVTAEAPYPGDGSVLSGTLELGSPGRMPFDRWLAPFATAVTAFLLGWFLVREIRVSRLLRHFT